MLDKSINASRSTETAITDDIKCDFVEECTRDYGGCGINVCFLDNNGYASSINPQGSLKRQLSD